MPPEITVVADDLTGAAEIAAIGHRFGRRSVVLTHRAPAPSGTEVAVYDTDSRLLDDREAARRVHTLAQSPALTHAPLVFKKTDSLLRGCVRAELEALVLARTQRRVLLLPANPGLGRVIASGRYLIRGAPIHQTGFARDPHHPVTTDKVVDMIGGGGALPVFARGLHDALPPEGIVIGDAQTDAELRQWATHIDGRSLPAGSAAFFTALLSERGATVRPTQPPAMAIGPILVLSGTTQPPPRSITSGASGVDPRSLFAPDAAWLNDRTADSGRAAQEAWRSLIARALSEFGLAIVTTAFLRSEVPGFAAGLRDLLATVGRTIVGSGGCNHLIVEGGATAAAIVQTLGWSALTVAHEWDQGVVTLQPRESSVFLTTKPGSYPWPQTLKQHLFAAARSSGRRTV